MGQDCCSNRENENGDMKGNQPQKKDEFATDVLRKGDKKENANPNEGQSPSRGE